MSKSGAVILYTSAAPVAFMWSEGFAPQHRHAYFLTGLHRSPGFESENLILRLRRPSVLVVA